jgi:YfiH family protein
MLEKVRKGNVDLILASELEAEHGIVVAFTGRSGGISEPPFDSLNLSYDVGDERGAVVSNRHLVEEILGIPSDVWVFGKQAHGSRVAFVGELERGRGATDHWSGLSHCDGLVTDREGLLLGVLTADCLPLVMVCGSRRAVGIAHVGWKGALYGIAVDLLHKLLECTGCRHEEIDAFLGPCIGPCCMVVGEDVENNFRKYIGDAAFAEGAGRKPRLDLVSICRSQLIGSGVEKANILSTGICTQCDPRYFSHRGSGGRTGRQAGIVAVI